MSEQYTGTVALKTDFTRYKREKRGREVERERRERRERRGEGVCDKKMKTNNTILTRALLSI